MREDDKISDVQTYLTKAVDNPADIHSLFGFLSRYLTEASSGTKYTSLLPITALVDKFLRAVKKFAYIKQEKKDTARRLCAELLEQQRHSKYYDHVRSWGLFALLLGRRSKKAKANQGFEKALGKLYSTLADIHNEATIKENSRHRSMRFFEFYEPDGADREGALECVKTAIELIDRDETLSDRAKKKIIRHLNDALYELRKSEPDWTVFFGKMKEAVIILGALGSLIGGVTDLTQARSELEEAMDIVGSTAVDQSYVSQLDNKIMEPLESPRLLPEPDQDASKEKSNEGSCSSNGRQGLDQLCDGGSDEE